MIEEISKAIEEALVRMKPEDIVIAVTRDAYRALCEEMIYAWDADPHPFLELYRLTAKGKTVITIQGVKIIPVQYGDGWAIVEKKFF